MANQLRNTAKYFLKEGRRKIYAGTTRRALEIRLREHQLDRNNDRITIQQEGIRTTPAAARQWERQQKAKGIPTGR